MDFEERAKVMAITNGWYINSNGKFECRYGDDEPYEVRSVCPTTDGCWSLLCMIDDIPVPKVVSDERLEAYQELGYDLIQVQELAYCM